MNPVLSPYGYNPYYYNNPMATPQQRLAEMEQHYPQLAQNQQNNMQNQPNGMQSNNMMLNNQNFVKCRAVTSIDEAKASMIDLDGSVHVFTDLGNKKIYTKQINLDGTATLNTYVLQPETDKTASQTEEKPQEVSNINLDDYVKREDLEQVCKTFNQQIDDFADRMQGYERAFALLQKEEKTAKGGKK